MPVSKKKTNNPFKRINWASRKTQLITTVLVFAVIGGGILIYQSFAATASFTYSRANANLAYSAAAGCSASPGSDTAGKGSTAIVRLSCPASVPKGSAEVHITNAFLSSTYVGLYFRVCAWAKGNGAMVLTMGVPNKLGNVTTLNINASAYTYYCTPVTTNSQLTTAAAVTGQFNTFAPSNISVSSLVLESVEGPVKTAPSK